VMIVNNTLQALAGAYTKTTASSIKNTAQVASIASAQQDEIVLSKEAQDFSFTLQKLKSMSTYVRTDKINYYENQLANGNYTVNAEDVAGKMLQMRY